VEVQESYTQPTAERKIIGADLWRVSRIGALASYQLPSMREPLSLDTHDKMNLRGKDQPGSLRAFDF